MNATILEGQKDRVREERKRLGLTQQEAADKCGVSRSQWMRYERGENLLDGAPARAFVLLGADGEYIVAGKRASSERQELWVRTIKASEIHKEKINNLVGVLDRLSEADLDIIIGLASRMLSKT